MIGVGSPGGFHISKKKSARNARNRTRTATLRRTDSEHAKCVNSTYPDCVKSIQEKNDCVYTVLGTHWNTLYPDCIRNIHAVNGRGYTVPGMH